MHRKGLVIGILILLIGVNIGSTFAGDIDAKTVSSVGFDGNTLYVGGSGEGNYTSIQEAINNASDGDTVFVYDDSSPYFESVLIEKSINLIGEDRNTTIVNGQNGQGAYYAVRTNANNILVSGFTLMGASSGVSLGGHYNQIFGNILCYNNQGVMVGSTGSDCLVQNNKIMYNTYGIKIEDYSDRCTDYVFDSNFICHNRMSAIHDDDREGWMYYTNNIIADNSYFGSGQTNYAFYKHIAGSVFHHNDVFLNYRNVISEAPRPPSNLWNNETGGNYWDDWEQNPGYPNTYIIPSDFIVQIDYKPQASPYFDCLMVSIPGYVWSSLNIPAYFFARTNVAPSNLTWFWEFGDGNTSNQKNPTHTYSSTGRYSVNVTITDPEGRTDTSKTTAIIGSPPYEPTINGPHSGIVGVEYTYSFVAEDPDGDDIIYHIWWGDMWIEDVGPYPSGQEINLSHSWMNQGSYLISAYVEDTVGLYSGESWFEVTMPMNQQSSDSLFLRFLERFPNMFPILRNLLEL